MNQITSDIYLSDYKSAINFHLLRRHQIRTIIFVGNFLKAGDAICNYRKLGIDHHWFWCADSLDANIAQFFQPTCEIMARAKKPVLFHCYAGISRSATLVMAYLMAAQIVGDVLQAYQLVKLRRNVIQPNPNFINQLYAWQAYRAVSAASHFFKKT